MKPLLYATHRVGSTDSMPRDQDDTTRPPPQETPSTSSCAFALIFRRDTPLHQRLGPVVSTTRYRHFQPSRPIPNAHANVSKRNIWAIKVPGQQTSSAKWSVDGKQSEGYVALSSPVDVNVFIDHLVALPHEGLGASAVGAALGSLVELLV